MASSARSAMPPRSRRSSERVPGFRFQVPGERVAVFMLGRVRRTKVCALPSTWNLELGAFNVKPSTWNYLAADLFGLMENTVEQVVEIDVYPTELVAEVVEQAIAYATGGIPG